MTEPISDHKAEAIAKGIIAIVKLIFKIAVFLIALHFILKFW